MTTTPNLKVKVRAGNFIFNVPEPPLHLSPHFASLLESARASKPDPSKPICITTDEDPVLVHPTLQLLTAISAGHRLDPSTFEVRSPLTMRVFLADARDIFGITVPETSTDLVYLRSNLRSTVDTVHLKLAQRSTSDIIIGLALGRFPIPNLQTIVFANKIWDITASVFRIYLSLSKTDDAVLNGHAPSWRRRSTCLIELLLDEGGPYRGILTSNQIQGLKHMLENETEENSEPPPK